MGDVGTGTGMVLILGFLVWLIRSASQGKAPVGPQRRRSDEAPENTESGNNNNNNQREQKEDTNLRRRNAPNRRVRRAQMQQQHHRLGDETALLENEANEEPETKDSDHEDDGKTEEQRKKEKELEEWAAKMSVSGEGLARRTADEDRQLNERIRKDVERWKIVDLSELAHKHSINIHDCIERMEMMKSKNVIQGLFDERGKFVYVTDEEMNKAANYLEQSGRVPIRRLVAESNQLIETKFEGNV